LPRGGLGLKVTRHFAPTAAAAIVIVGYAFVRSSPYQLAVGVNIVVAAIAAVGLTLAIGGAGQLALGQAGFMGVGGYGTAYLLKEHSTNYLLALLFSIVLTLILGALVGYIALRLRGNYLAMATLAVGSGIYSLLTITTALGGANGYAPIPPPKILGHVFLQPRAQYLLVAVVLIIVLVLMRWVVSSRIGRELAAIRDDEVAARAIGVKITVRKVQVFAIASAIGGLAGAVNGPLQTAIDPSLYSPAISLQLFIMVVLGGLGSIYGAVFGAALVTYLIQSVSGDGSAALTILGVVVVVFMAVLPKGLAGIPDLARTNWKRFQRRRRSGPDAPVNAEGHGATA
jgi:branched-chain amino acid transport system permease protein